MGRSFFVYIKIKQATMMDCRLFHKECDVRLMEFTLYTCEYNKS